MLRLTPHPASYPSLLAAPSPLPITRSPDEPTALVQGSGGPCAIIAAAQGHLLKNLIYGVEVRQGGDWRTPQDIDAALAVALTEILVKCAREDRDGTDRPVLVLPVGPVTTIEAFHANLAATAYGSAAEAQATIASNIGLFHSEHGVLLFLYSCVATRGIAQIAEDLGLDVEPLVVLPFGHANQSLINLMLTGIATPHVHDGVKVRNFLHFSWLSLSPRFRVWLVWFILLDSIIIQVVVRCGGCAG